MIVKIHNFWSFKSALAFNNETLWVFPTKSKEH